MLDPLATLSAMLQPVFETVVADLETEPDPAAPVVADPTIRPSDRADAQINGALPLAKQLSVNPREVAQRVVDTGVLDAVGTVEIAGPGFINVTFSDAWLNDQLGALSNDVALGIDPVVDPKTIVVDYSAPNVAKEMHAGHLRTTIIGDSLVRLLEACGHTVIRENHVGDWGRPFGMLIEHLLDIGEDVAADGLSQGDLDGFYKAANAKFADDEEFATRARDRVVMLQSGDDETRRLWQRLVDMSNDYFNAVYRKLGVLLSDDDLMGESFYQPLMQGVYGRLVEQDVVSEDDGAMVVYPPGFTNRDGDHLPMIVKSRTGAFMYATSDVACVVDRVERLGADLILYVVGAPQAQHLQMVFETCRMVGWLEPPTEAIHVSFGSVLGNDRKMLRSRSGDAVKLIELLDEAIARADASIAEKNPSLTGDSRAKVARQVGIGAVKYADLSTDRIKDYVFDWDRMLAFDGNTGPYLQYAHARICSIFRKAGVDRPSVRSAAFEVVEPQEHALALAILGLPGAVDMTVETYSPHKLCTYAYDLASIFTSFYVACPILKSEEPARSSRLALADLTARVLERTLDLLGIEAPDEM